MGCWDSFDRVTPKITINNMTLGQVGKAVRAESCWLKIFKLLSAIVVGVTAVVCMSYFFVNHKNVNKLQDNCTDLLTAQYPEHPEYTVYCSNSTLYDFNYQFGPFSDEVDAKEYGRRLGNCDAECQTIGTRWSYVYILGSATMCCFTFQSILLSIGVFFYPLRLVAKTCQPIFCLFNLGVVCTFAVFRFNFRGSLASISLAPALYKEVDGVATISTDRTYEDDGQLILRLFTISLAFVILQCCLGCYSAAPPTQDEVRKWGIAMEEEEEYEENVQNDAEDDTWENTVIELDHSLALVCLILNCLPFTSGIGTCISACAGDQFKGATLVIGITQFLLTAILVGWIWSIVWGIWILEKSKK